MAIRGFDGPPGAGKTSAMVDNLYRASRRGTGVHANIPLYDLRLVPLTKEQEKAQKKGKVIVREPLNPATFGYPWAGYIPDVPALLKVRKGLIAVDEIDMWFSSVEHHSIDFMARRFWTQHRKSGLNIDWACTDFERCFNVIRDITTWVHSCFMFEFMPKVSFQKMWQPTRNETGKTKTLLWSPFFFHEHLFQLYHSNFIVGSGAGNSGEGFKGKTKRVQVANEFGDAELGADIVLKIGTQDEIRHVAACCTMFLPAALHQRQQVAPLICSADVIPLLIWCARILSEGKHAAADDRVAARRLRPVLTKLGGRELARLSSLDGGKVLAGMTPSRVIQFQLLESGLPVDDDAPGPCAEVEEESEDILEWMK